MSDVRVHRVYMQSPTSLAVIIPKDFAERLGLRDGCYVSIKLVEGKLIIQKVNTEAGD